MPESVEILSVNVSGSKGKIKKPVKSVNLTETGIPEDAHQGYWHRQLSMLGIESIEKFKTETGRKVSFGEFAENITTRGMDIYKSAVFDRFYNDNIDLEITQVGIKCQGSNCVIYKKTGKCIMPDEGILLLVLKGGRLKPGDRLYYKPKSFMIKVITVSDRASRGIYEDKSGPLLATAVNDFFRDQKRISDIDLEIIPDEPAKIKSAINKAINNQTDIILTTGGTGIGPRDYTPEVVKPMLDREIPGIMELIRVKYGMKFPNALLSRGVAGTIGKTLVYTLPGSEKAVKEYTEEIFKTLHHSLLMIHGIGTH